ncbi:EF-hand domain-containing protein [Uliginosibacterium sp. sgz301328]|uniref:EF-hand domain-containing protein n=1 Tax=Uliginosibacterium sp. sgz301328 TaxID=3243764 RepID=UPI00359DE9FA
MVSSVSSISSSLVSSLMQARQKPSASDVAGEIFSKLDTSGQGYLDKASFTSALSSTAGSSSSDAEEVFNAIDEDGDGKVTQSELADTLQKLSDQLDGARMNQAMSAGGFAPPPPPPSDESDTGMTQDELTSFAEDVSSTDGDLSSMLSDVASNFDAADTNGDGKVTFDEAMTYQQTKASSSTTNADASGSANTDAQSDRKVLQQIMQLVRAYGASDESGYTSSARLSVSA